ncbi:IclR family transcriptional regulator [Rhodococcus opacus]|uniref:IclR family transcriptional regulator n=1 Tax=Rhodococcus opacus TaxID=37919 RepID=UPI00155A2674|nr:IclR family transcriptional regulator [Rhodococcus opacus]
MVARSETGVGVLARAVAILDVVESSPMGASDLARELDLSLSTTYRLATDMVKHGLLRKDEEGRFYLGQRFVTTVLSDLAIPALRELSEATGESAQLWVRRGESRLCAASVDSQHELRVALPVGTLVPLPQGSSGHVLSGDWEADPEAVKSGWWVSVSERTPGSASISAPVRRHGEIVAAVCVSGPEGRMGKNLGASMGRAVVAAARQIEKSVPGD